MNPWKMFLISVSIITYSTFSLNSFSAETESTDALPKVSDLITKTKRFVAKRLHPGDLKGNLDETISMDSLDVYIKYDLVSIASSLPIDTGRLKQQIKNLRLIVPNAPSTVEISAAVVETNRFFADVSSDHLTEVFLGSEGHIVPFQRPPNEPPYILERGDWGQTQFHRIRLLTADRKEIFEIDFRAEGQQNKGPHQGMSRQMGMSIWDQTDEDRAETRQLWAQKLQMYSPLELLSYFAYLLDHRQDPRWSSQGPLIIKILAEAGHFNLFFRWALDQCHQRLDSKGFDQKMIFNNSEFLSALKEQLLLEDVSNVQESKQVLRTTSEVEDRRRVKDLMDEWGRILVESSEINPTIPFSVAAKFAEAVPLEQSEIYQEFYENLIRVGWAKEVATFNPKQGSFPEGDGLSTLWLRYKYAKNSISYSRAFDEISHFRQSQTSRLFESLFLKMTTKSGFEPFLQKQFALGELRAWGSGAFFNIFFQWYYTYLKEKSPLRYWGYRCRRSILSFIKPVRDR